MMGCKCHDDTTIEARTRSTRSKWGNCSRCVGGTLAIFAAALVACPLVVAAGANKAVLGLALFILCGSFLWLGLHWVAMIRDRVERLRKRGWNRSDG